MKDIELKEQEFQNYTIKVPDNEISNNFINNIQYTTEIMRNDSGTTYFKLPWETLQEALATVAYKFSALHEHNVKLQRKIEEMTTKQAKNNLMSDKQIISTEQIVKRILSIEHEAYKTVIFREWTDKLSLSDYKFNDEEIANIIFNSSMEYFNVVNYKTIQNKYEKAIKDCEQESFTIHDYTYAELYIIYDQKIKATSKGLFLTIITSKIALPLIHKIKED